MRTKTLLKLAFIALSTHSVAFAGSDSYNGQDLNEANLERKHPHQPALEELLSTDPLALVEAPAAQGVQCSFDTIPSEIIKKILEGFSKADLKNVRLVEKKLRNVAASLLTDVRIPGNIPSEAQAKKFFQDLATEFWEGKKLPEAFINLFRHAPLKELKLEKLNAETLKTLIPAFPRVLEVLFLMGHNLGDEEMKAVAQHLPATLRDLCLYNNNIGPKGAKALAEKLSSTLQTLYLGKNNLGDEGVRALAQKFPATLRWLGLHGNNIGDEGAKALAEKLPTGLLFLFLDGNEIGDEGLKALLAAIPRTDLELLGISVPEGSPLREQFNNLRNRQGQPINVVSRQ